MTPRLGTLALQPARERPELLSPTVADAIQGELGKDAYVTEIDPDDSGNCVIVLGKRGGELRPAACVIMASTRADVNGLVRKHIDARRASFAPQDWAVGETAMEYGGITPIGLPDGWPVLIDSAVAKREWVIVGSGLRRSKLVLPGASLALIPNAVVLDGLGRPV